MHEKIPQVFAGAITDKNSKSARLFHNAAGKDRLRAIGWSVLFVLVTGAFVWLGFSGNNRWPAVGWYMWIGMSSLLFVFGVATLIGHLVMFVKGK